MKRQQRQKRCPDCGTDKGGFGKDKTQFGPASGLCKACSDRTVRELCASVGLGPRGGKLRRRP